MSRLFRAKGSWDRIHSVFQLPDHQGSGKKRGGEPQFFFQETDHTARQNNSPHHSENDGMTPHVFAE